MDLKISTLKIPRPKIILKKPRLGKKKKVQFAKEKEKLIQSMRRHGLEDEERIVRKAVSFIGGIPDIPRGRQEKLLIVKAFDFSKEKHGKQKRLSGEPYFLHAFETALILADHGLDGSTISAALLHDILEDTNVTEDELLEKFGPEVLSLVKGVTKLGEYTEHELEEGEMEYLRDLLAASSKDLRVLLIKLADKLHNLRTVKFLPKKRRKEICINALEVYAPLAEKLGLLEFKEEIQDVCLKELHPKKFRSLSKKISVLKSEKEKEISELVEILSVKRIGRRKRFFQKYGFRKQERNVYYYYDRTELKGQKLSELFDFVVLVLLCKSAPECYRVLETVHSEFFPIPGKVIDYIASPLHTYQSIHTSIIGPRGTPLKIFIRTKEMDEIARKGITVKLRKKIKVEELEREEFREMTNMNAGHSEFVSALKSDFLENPISIFNAKGTKTELPHGSTPVDFAFKVSPKKAPRLAQVEVNGLIKPVWYTLKSGDRIKLIFSRDKTISCDWLDFSRTYYAKEMIKDELNIKKVRVGEKKTIHYTFHASKTTGLLERISKTLDKNDAELESISIERISQKLFEGKLVAVIESTAEERELFMALDSTKGIKQA